MLAIASVVGREFELDLLEPVTEMAADEIVDALDHAVAAAVVVEVPDAIGRYSSARSRAIACGALSASRGSEHTMIAVTAPVVPARYPTAATPSAITDASRSWKARSARSSSTAGWPALRISAAPRPPSAKKLPTVTTVSPNATLPRAVGESRCASTSMPTNATTWAAAARIVNRTAPTAPRSLILDGLSASGGRFNPAGLIAELHE